MRPLILTGSKQEIIEALARIDSDVREAIVFFEDDTQVPQGLEWDSFAEMEPFTVRVGGADYSR